MRNFLVALQFLTIIPIRLKKAVSEDDLTKSRTYFPLVGLLLGVILALVNLIGSSLFPPLAAKAIVLITLIIATRALHIGEFADACDGFFGRKSGNETPGTRREGQLGYMGIISLVSLLLIKFALLYSLVGIVEFRALLLMPVIGRWAMVVLGAISSYSHERVKMKSPPSGRDNYKVLLRTGVITFIISLLLFRLFVIPLMLAVYLSILALRWFSVKKTGSVSGDVVGATVELMEVVTLLLILLMST